MSRFLRFLSVLCMMLFVGNAFADDYMCTSVMNYTACNDGYGDGNGGAINGKCELRADNYTCATDRKYSSCATNHYLKHSVSSRADKYHETPVPDNECAPCPDGATFCPGGTAAPMYKVTLNANGGTSGAIDAIYRGTGSSWYVGTTSTDIGNAFASVASSNLIPTRSLITSGATTTTYTFNGFWSAATGGNQMISASGALTSNGSSTVPTANATWYARWIETTTTGCPAGQFVNGDGDCESCAPGTYQSEDGFSGASCTPCGAGKYSATTGATSCSAIKAGCYGTSADNACPSVCGADSYSDAGAASCTECATANGYRNNADNIAENHAGVSSCKVTCSAGKAVIQPSGKCVTPTVPGWFTDKSQTVMYGNLSTMNFCPNTFDEGSGHDTQCGACSASDIGAGKTFSPHTTARYLRIKSLSASGADIGLVEIKPYFLDADTDIYYPIPVGLYDAGMSGVSGYPEAVVDGKYLPEHFPSGVSSGSRAILPAKDSTFTVMVLGGSPVDISAIDVTFFGIASTSIVYEIEVSIDGSNWQSIYSNSNSVETPNAMYSSLVPSGKLVTKRFIAYGESASASGQYASNRDVMLCVAGNGLTGTLCPTNYPNSVAGSDEKTDCYIDCLETIPNGELQADRDKSYFGGTVCGYTVTCNPGYSGSTGPDLVTLDPKCTPKCVRVVLQQTLEGRSPLFIFSKYNDKNSWYSDDSCTTQISEITKPAADGWVFGGYWSVKGEDSNMLIMADATLPVAAGFERVPYDSTTIKVTPGNYTSDQTWYARWVKECESTASALCLGPYYNGTKVQYVNCCLPGYNKTGMGISTDGTTCPSGT